MEEKHGGKSLIYKSVTMELESLSYPGNVWGMVITGTIGPLGKGRISQIQFLSMSQRHIQIQKDGLVTKRKSYFLLGIFLPKAPVVLMICLIIYTLVS